MKKIMILLCIVVMQSLLARQCHAQNTFGIRGTVVLPNNKLQQGIAVYVHDALTNNIIKTELTDSNGKFEVLDISKDSVMLFVSETGFIPFQSRTIYLSTMKLLDAITVDLKAIVALDKITAVSKPSFIKRAADRTIVTPDALISSAGTNLWEMLGKSPGVMISNDGVIKLKGKAGTLVLIDDKPTNLSGPELENYLKAIPTASIKQIELLPNPPAQYDAAGNSGIIIIRTKRNKLQGLYGNISLNYAQGKYARSMDNLSINYGNKKLLLFLNLATSFQNNYQDLNIYRIYKNVDLSEKSFFNQQTYIRVKSNSYSSKLG
jgi:hypothetical protein